MKIGIIKEGKTPPDRRVGLTPAQCAHLKETYPELEIKVQRSPIPCFHDEDYANAGTEFVDKVNDCDVIFGVKEVKYEMLAAGKTMLFFSHTIKKQQYNRDLLLEVLKKNIRLIDYETLTYSNGFRVLGFGRYAGIVGAYNALIAHGKRYNSFELKPAFQCEDMKEMAREMGKIELGHAKIIISGGGKVANGSKETLNAAGIREVSIPEFLNESFDEPVYCNADILDYHEKDGKAPASFEEFVKDSTVWKNTFTKFTNVADIFISAHFWDNKSAHFFTEKDVKYISDNNFNALRVPLHYRDFSPNFMEFRTEGFELLDSLVAWGNKYNVYLILDMHAAPGAQNTSDFSDSELNGDSELFTSYTNQRWLASTWKHIANYYKSEPVIAGFDLLNEPARPGVATTLRNIYEQCIDSIRAVDPNHMVIIEGNWYGNDHTGLFPRRYGPDLVRRRRGHHRHRPERRRACTNQSQVLPSSRGGFAHRRSGFG